MKKRTAGSSAKGREDAGFTLLELLVSIVLIALMLALMPGAMRLARQAWQGDERLQIVHQEDAGMDFMQSRLEVAQPLFNRANEGRRALAFSGTGERVVFVAPMPQSAPLSGLYQFDAFVELNGGKTQNLVIAYRHFSGEADAAGPFERKVLLRNLSGFSLRYLPPSLNDEEAPSWRSDWLEQDSLPSLIELKWTTGIGETDRHRSVIVTTRLRRD
ncbi:MAG: prepilin-type N-terminal cleavage/methylation domain-containing protein [Alphaproteobacteria bacterium]|nr:prepilin-type N-terminal cleavage/methylation domain-containing protein [Alphaproteobacteria bacterium]